MKEPAKAKTGVFLLHVWYVNGRAQLFEVPIDISLDMVQSLIHIHGQAKIRRVEFVDPIAQSVNANDAPVMIQKEETSDGPIYSILPAVRQTDTTRTSW